MNPTTSSDNAAVNMKRCFGGVYAGKRVLVTGHTGFKGAWLAEWLLQLGAEVTGLALPPPTNPSLFDQLGLANRIRHVIGDIRDAKLVRDLVTETAPDFVFHLAAQPLVRLSYEQPLETYATNVMGTAHVLDALRSVQRPCAAVMVTTDKCYENREWVHSYREEDPMGGFDPYSSSKGAAELVIAAYRRSFFSAADANIRVASARAGNVIGGGDWALDRIVPDCIRALQQGRSIPVRNKIATRPWQHVLEPLSGYLWLGACLSNPLLTPGATHYSRSQLEALGHRLSSPFNFGPPLAANRTVSDLVDEVLKHWPGSWKDNGDSTAPHEAKLLSLATEKAFHLVHWFSVWSFSETVAETVDWYSRTYRDSRSVAQVTSDQLNRYIVAATRDRAKWAR